MTQHVNKKKQINIENRPGGYVIILAAESFDPAEANILICVPAL